MHAVARADIFHVPQCTVASQQRGNPNDSTNNQSHHAAKAEIGALYINCREAVPSRHTLEFLGHTQPPTPMQTDNTTALGVVNNNVMKKLKAMDMKHHWLRDRIIQKQFRHYWAWGADNKGDYVTKHHAPIHHQAMRVTFLTNIATLTSLRAQRTPNVLPAARVC